VHAGGVILKIPHLLLFLPYYWSQFLVLSTDLLVDRLQPIEFCLNLRFLLGHLYDFLGQFLVFRFELIVHQLNFLGLIQLLLKLIVEIILKLLNIPLYLNFYVWKLFLVHSLRLQLLTLYLHQFHRQGLKWSDQLNVLIFETVLVAPAVLQFPLHLLVEKLLLITEQLLQTSDFLARLV